MSIRVRPEIPVPEDGKRPEKVAVMCQQLADNYAEGIAAHPADWHMLQKFFLADLDPAKAPRAKAAVPEPSEPSELQSAESLEPSEPAQSGESVGSGEPVDSGEPVEPMEPSAQEAP